MTVKTFDPSQTTTLQTPSKVLAEQASENGSSSTTPDGVNHRIGFVSLG